MLNGSLTNINIQTTKYAGGHKTINAIDSRSTTLGIDSGTIDITTTANADISITNIDNAIEQLGVNQATFGAINRGLETRKNIVNRSLETLTESLSRLEDADIAKETANLQLLQVQQQMAMEALKIIMKMPQNALNLMR